MSLHSLRWPRRTFLNRHVIEIQLIDNRAYNLRAREVMQEWRTYEISVEMWEGLKEQFNSFPPRNGWPAEKFPIFKELLIEILGIEHPILIHPKKQRQWKWEENPEIVISIIAVIHIRT